MHTLNRFQSFKNVPFLEDNNLNLVLNEYMYIICLYICYTEL